MHYEYSKAKIHIWFEGNFLYVYLKIITQKNNVCSIIENAQWEPLAFSLWFAGDVAECEKD